VVSGRLRDEIAVALAAVAASPYGGWQVLLVKQDGTISFQDALNRLEARKALTFAASLARERRTKKRRGPLVPTLDRNKLVRPYLKPERRFQILRRDGHTCRYCGRSAPEVVLHIDHVIPVARGGTDDDTNLVVACQDCNLGKKAS
jgi:5-methylcytosine-specific restriction endonuclease McrA